MPKGKKFTKSEMEIYNEVKEKVDTTPINKCLDLMYLDKEMWINLNKLNWYIDKIFRKIYEKDLSLKERRKLSNYVRVIRRRINKDVKKD